MNKNKYLEDLLLTVAPLIAGVAITISYLPQLWLTFSTKNVTGQSVSFWVLLVISLSGLVLQQYGIIKYKGNRKYTGIITQSINLFFAFLMLLMVIIFGG